jgi:hypothetical protein
LKLEPEQEQAPLYNLVLPAAVAKLCAAVAAGSDGPKLMLATGAVAGLISAASVASSAIDDHATRGTQLIQWGQLRHHCLQAVAAVATSEERCVQLGALEVPIPLPSGGIGTSTLIAVCLHVMQTGKFDLEGSRAAINILRNLSLPNSNTVPLLAAGALAERGLLAHVDHKDPNAASCAAGAMRQLAGRSTPAALGLAQVPGSLERIVQLPLGRTHPHCRVELARLLVLLLEAAAGAEALRASLGAVAGDLDATQRLAARLATAVDVEASGDESVDDSEHFGSMWAAVAARVAFLLAARQPLLQLEALRGLTAAGDLAVALGVGWELDMQTNVCGAPLGRRVATLAHPCGLAWHGQMQRLAAALAKRGDCGSEHDHICEIVGQR